MKKVTLLVASVLCSLGSFAQEQYPVNWDKDANLTATRADRVLSTITLNTENAGPQVIELGSTGVVYNDLSDQKFNVQPGESLEFKISYSGTWMHSYYYVDMNKDGQFEWNDITPGHPGSELLGYAFWSGDLAQENSGYASDGTHKTGNARSAIDAPAFNAPEQPGEYRLRIKIDWNNIDPAGQYGSNYTGNFIDENGGYIVDVTLVVEGNVEPEPFVPVEYGPVLLSEGDNLVCFKIHNLGADEGTQYKGNDCYVKYVAESAGTWNSLFHTNSADDADNFAFFAAEDGGVYIKDVTADKFVTWKQNAEGGINWGAHQLTACQVTLVDTQADAKSWFIVDDENTEGRYDILPLETANNGWSFMGGIDQPFVVLNLEKKTDRNIKWVFEKVEGETPVDPEPPVVEPEELTWSPVVHGGIYAIVNLQSTGNNFYLDYVDDNLTPVPADECNSLFEWPETAKFEAVTRVDGSKMFKNCATGNFLTWKGTANRANTTGLNENKGWINYDNYAAHWYMHESERFEGAYWFNTKSRNDSEGNGLNMAGTLIISKGGEWNAWNDSEDLTNLDYSNTFGFVRLDEVPVEPVYDYIAAVTPVLAEAAAALEGHDNVWVTTISDKLITRNNQFSSNNSDPQEGSLNNLLDGNPSTFWHSNWHQGNNRPMHSDWLQVELDEAIDGDVLLTFVRRNAANDQVTLLDVETSMDGENFTHAAYIDMPNSGAGKTEQKVFALEEKAKFLRFWADETVGNNGGAHRAYWHCGDFQLQTVSTNLNVDAPDYAYPTAVAELQDAIAAAQAVENGTQADVDALVAAIEAYKAALAGYPEFTEWTGDVQIAAGEVNNIDDLLNVDVYFNRALTLEDSNMGVLGAVFGTNGDAYAMVFDVLCGEVTCEPVKTPDFVGQVAHLTFAKLDDLTPVMKEAAKAAAAKIGAFEAQPGEALLMLCSNSFVIDGEKLNEFVCVSYELEARTITGVDTVVLNAKGEVYDLQGRRTKATNGIRIQNGRVILN